jgi:DNA-binding CsgD family transcriptional regulator
MLGGIYNIMESKHSEKRLKARYREEYVLEKRKQGYTLATIAKELGIAEASVSKCATRALQRLNRIITDSAEEYRRMSLERLDSYLKALKPAMDKGDQKAIATAVKIDESRRKLMGTDAPIQVVQKTIASESVDDIRAKILEQLTEHNILATREIRYDVDSK